MRLFVMTSGVQTGKTTWIRRMLHAACSTPESDAQAYGVDYDAAAIKPLHISGVYTPPRFEGGEKLGIDAVLLPGGERFSFASAQPASGQSACAGADEPSSVPSGSGHSSAASGSDPSASGRSKPQARWRFDTSAIERINAYFLDPSCASCDLLLVDELGWIEFERGEGFVNALSLLDVGVPTNALVVIRKDLLHHAQKRWGDFAELTPTYPIDRFIGMVAR